MTREERSLRHEELWVLGCTAAATGMAPLGPERVTAREWDNSTVYRVQTAEREIIVKLWKRANIARLRHWQEDSNALARRLESDSALLRLPEVYGVDEQRPAVVMESLQGTPGAPWLARLLSEPSSPKLDRAGRIFECWGRALAAFHRASILDSDRGALRQEASHRADRIRRRLCLPKWKVAPLQGSLMPCRSHNDVGFHNILLMKGDVLGFIDYFESRTITTVHQDVAAVLAWLEDAYRDSPGAERHRCRSRLTPAFLGGYRQESGIALDRGRHQDLLRLFLSWENFDWVRTALRRHHFRQALACFGRGTGSWFRLWVNLRREHHLVEGKS